MWVKWRILCDWEYSYSGMSIKSHGKLTRSPMNPLSAFLENLHEYDLHGVWEMGSISSMQIRRNHFKNSQALVRMADGNSAVKFQ